MLVPKLYIDFCGEFTLLTAIIKSCPSRSAEEIITFCEDVVTGNVFSSDRSQGVISAISSAILPHSFHAEVDFEMS